MTPDTPGSSHPPETSGTPASPEMSTPATPTTSGAHGHAPPPARPTRGTPAIGTILVGLIGLASLVLSALVTAGTGIDVGRALPFIVLGFGVIVVVLGLLGLRRSRP